MEQTDKLCFCCFKPVLIIKDDTNNILNNEYCEEHYSLFQDLVSIRINDAVNQHLSTKYKQFKFFFY